MQGTPYLDLFAFFWFMFTWLGYSYVADNLFKHKAVSILTKSYRYQWMIVMLQRDNRIVDTQIQGILSRSASFFASTAMLVIGGSLASLSSADKILEVTQTLPFVAEVHLVQIEIKLIILVLIFIFAFFKFLWSFRLFNNCSILMGAAPLPEQLTEGQSHTIASTIAGIHTQAGKHFNSGIRAYMFALPILGWFINPYIFIAATTLVTLVIQRREFYSKTHDLLKKSLATYDDFENPFSAQNDSVAKVHKKKQ